MASQISAEPRKKFFRYAHEVVQAMNKIVSDHLAD